MHRRAASAALTALVLTAGLASCATNSRHPSSRRPSTVGATSSAVTSPPPAAPTRSTATHEPARPAPAVQDIERVPVTQADKWYPRGAPPRVAWREPVKRWRSVRHPPGDRAAPEAPGRQVTAMAFKRPLTNCWTLSDSRPVWTTCYVSAGHAAWVGAPSVGPNARWLVATIGNGDFDAALIDGRSGVMTKRLHFGDRVQDVRMEDSKHFLVVLNRPVSPPDDLPFWSWIVRCDVRTHCEETTARIRINVYDDLEILQGAG